MVYNIIGILILRPKKHSSIISSKFAYSAKPIAICGVSLAVSPTPSKRPRPYFDTR